MDRTVNGALVIHFVERDMTYGKNISISLDSNQYLAISSGTWKGKDWKKRGHG